MKKENKKEQEPSVHCFEVRRASNGWVINVDSSKDSLSSRAGWTPASSVRESHVAKTKEALLSKIKEIVKEG